MLKALKSLLKRQETADGVAAQVADVEELNDQLSSEIAQLERQLGESLTGEATEGSVVKLERELEGARREQSRVAIALQALRTKHRQRARSELEDRAEKQIDAATKAVAAVPAAIVRYKKATGPVVEALRTMRHMTDIALALPHRASTAGVPQTLGKAFAAWRLARIPNTERGSELLLWPLRDDPDAPRMVTTIGRGTAQAGDWPMDLAEAGKRAADALLEYERTAPRLRVVVAELGELTASIEAARRDGDAAGLEVPDVVAQHRAITFLDKVEVPDVPDDAPPLELSMFSRRHRPHFAGIEV